MKGNAIQVFFVLILIPCISFAEDILTGQEWKTTFCDKTLTGENLNTGWTFKTYINENCDELTVYYLSGYEYDKSLNKPLTLPLTVNQNGNICVKGVYGKEACWNVKAVGDGVYHRIEINSEKHFITDKTPVDGKQF